MSRMTVDMCSCNQVKNTHGSVEKLELLFPFVRCFVGAGSSGVLSCFFGGFPSLGRGSVDEGT